MAAEFVILWKRPKQYHLIPLNFIYLNYSSLEWSCISLPLINIPLPFPADIFRNRYPLIKWLRNTNMLKFLKTGKMIRTANLLIFLNVVSLCGIWSGVFFVQLNSWSIYFIFSRITNGVGVKFYKSHTSCFLIYNRVRY